MKAKYTVVMADDSTFTRKLVATYLSNSEFKLVADGDTGASAIKLFEQHKPDLVLLDVIMPEQDGFAALKAIIKIDPKAKVLMLSSLGTENAVTECLAAGARTFVQKPFDKESLLSNLRETAGT